MKFFKIVVTLALLLSIATCEPSLRLRADDALSILKQADAGVTSFIESAMQTINKTPANLEQLLSSITKNVMPEAEGQQVAVLSDSDAVKVIKDALKLPDEFVRQLAEQVTSKQITSDSLQKLLSELVSGLSLERLRIGEAMMPLDTAQHYLTDGLQATLNVVKSPIKMFHESSGIDMKALEDAFMEPLNTAATGISDLTQAIGNLDFAVGPLRLETKAFAPEA